jgi:hypothetical protein
LVRVTCESRSRMRPMRCWLRCEFAVNEDETDQDEPGRDEEETKEVRSDAPITIVAEASRAGSIPPLLTGTRSRWRDWGFLRAEIEPSCAMHHPVPLPPLIRARPVGDAVTSYNGRARGSDLRSDPEPMFAANTAETALDGVEVKSHLLPMQKVVASSPIIRA